MDLTLRHHNAQANYEGVTPQLWHEEFYIVSYDGRRIGQIRNRDRGPNAGVWFWCVLEGPRHFDEIETSGYCDTLKESKIRFAACWESLQRRVAKAAKRY